MITAYPIEVWLTISVAVLAIVTAGLLWKHRGD